jgi:hypothetical protein
VLDALEADWAQRRYGPEEQPWLAWLLRFALSEVDDPQGQGRFRMMPGALDSAGGQDERWTHVALDEAQDLSVDVALAGGHADLAILFAVERLVLQGLILFPLDIVLEALGLDRRAEAEAALQGSAQQRQVGVGREHGMVGTVLAMLAAGEH